MFGVKAKECYHIYADMKMRKHKQHHSMLYFEKKNKTRGEKLRICFSAHTKNCNFADDIEQRY